MPGTLYGNRQYREVPMSVLKLEVSPAPAPTAVVRLQGNYHLVATELLRPGQRILCFEGELRPRPSRFSLQVDVDLHLEVPAGTDLETILDRYAWRCLNHSCDPSAVIRGRELIARRRIEPWHEVTFDYDCTEYDMAEPFQCRCGSARCRGLIRGFRHLTAAQRWRYRTRLADYLRRGHLPEQELRGMGTSA